MLQDKFSESSFSNVGKQLFFVEYSSASVASVTIIRARVTEHTLLLGKFW